MYRSGDRTGKPLPMRHARKGKVALLTTRHPDHDSEAQRIVFGIFKIIKLTDNDGEEIQLKGNPNSAIRLPEAAMLSLPYWDFKAYPQSAIRRP